MEAFGLSGVQARERANELLATPAERGGFAQPGTHKPWTLLLRGSGIPHARRRRLEIESDHEEGRIRT